MFKKMMERRDSKEFSFEIFFPEYLEKTWAKIYDKEGEEDEKRNQNTGPHVEKIEERSYKSSERKCSAITHKYLGGMDIVKHKSYEYRHHDGYHGSSDIGLIEKEYDSQDKEDKRHKSSRESIESIRDIDSIDDRDSSKEGEYRIK